MKMGRRHPEFSKYQAIGHKAAHGSNGGSYEYEHFPVVCPTCEGKGQICEVDNGFVTFVPVKDDRLKPAWIKLKIASMMLVLLLVGGISTYFLYPRTVEFHVSAHNILDFSFQTKDPWMEYTFDVNIKNNNFFGVTIKNIKMNLLYMKQTIAKLEAGTIHVSIRNEKKTIIKMNATYEDDVSSRYLKKQCYTERDYVGQLMQTSGELDYWVHSEHIESRDDYFYTDCGSLIFPLIVKTTIRPTTTTVATTTLSPNTTTITIKTDKTAGTTSTTTVYNTTTNAGADSTLKTNNFAPTLPSNEHAKGHKMSLYKSVL